MSDFNLDNEKNKCIHGLSPHTIRQKWGNPRRTNPEQSNPEHSNPEQPSTEQPSPEQPSCSEESEENVRKTKSDDKK